MDVFRLRDAIIGDYSQYITSFFTIADERIKGEVEDKLASGILWPAPLLQLNPTFERGGSIDELVAKGLLHPDCSKIFRGGKAESDPVGVPMQLYRHQTEAIEAAATGDNYVLTTGTGSGKSLSYIIPIVDAVLRSGSGRGIKAIIVYPMNALANSQELELQKFLHYGFDKPKVTFRRYTGQESQEQREEIAADPPDILLTNYVMLELILTRPFEKRLVQAASRLRYLVFDELHTYRGRQGADVALLIRRLRNRLTPVGEKSVIQCIGTSATLAGPGSFEEQRREVAAVAGKLFGEAVSPERVIVETLRRETEDESGYGSPSFREALRRRVGDPGAVESLDADAFMRDALSVWIERNLGLEERDGRLARCKPRAHDLLSSIQALKSCHWHTDGWLNDALDKIESRFEDACERWRGLYRAALAQKEAQHAIAGDASRSQREREMARALRRQAEDQIDILVSTSSFLSDFYPYRYFACEGFLPGYNFPRLPLNAFLPGRRAGRGRDEYISRPRFLAISEFGPGSFIYHEGSRYVISRVIMDLQENETLGSGRAKQCEACGYIHPLDGTNDGPDLCELCGERLPQAMTNLFRMRNVSTRRRDRINSDEEERTRFGYSLSSGFRFASHGGMPAFAVATATDADGKPLAVLRYGHGATLWRVNLGWTNRTAGSPSGFLLNVEKGVWVKEGQESKLAGADQELEDAGPGRVQRVIPYVEDRKNCLLFTPSPSLSAEAMLSLAEALKQGIRQSYQLEEMELAVETLPAGGTPRAIFLHESAEGGAGVLRRLADEAEGLKRAATRALELCHFDPETGEDRRKASHAAEDCVAACYDCLLNYGNQRVHESLDRHIIKDYLLALASGSVAVSPGKETRGEHLSALLAQCETGLERSWLELLEQRGHTLPSHAQTLIEECHARPDFLYRKDRVAIYIDGPVHEWPERKTRDAAQNDALEDRGYTVLRFSDAEQWTPILDRYPNIFGRKQ